MPADTGKSAEIPNRTESHSQTLTFTPQLETSDYILACTNASHFLHNVVRVIRSRRKATPGLLCSTAIDTFAVISSSVTADELKRAAQQERCAFKVNEKDSM